MQISHQSTVFIAGNDLPQEPPMQKEASYPALHEAEEILQHLAYIPSDRPVRRLAEALLRNQQSPLDDHASLFMTLAGRSPKHWRERTVAAWALGCAPLSPKERDAAVGMLLDALEDRQKDTLRKRLRRDYLRGVAAIPLAGLINTLLFGPYYVPFWHKLIPITVMTAFVLSPLFLLRALFLAAGHKRQVNSLRAAAAIALGRLQATEAAGALAGLLSDKNQEVQEAAALALHDVLPALTPEQFGTFGAQSVINLGQALSHRDNLLTFKVLEALEKVGTSHAIPYVQRVIHQGRTTRLKDAALDVLAVLEDRSVREGESRTLMRAVQYNPSEKHLLHPVGNVEEETQIQESGNR